MTEEELRFTRDQYLDQPKEISLETYAKCNAVCSFCPYPTLDRIGTRMSDDLIARLVDEMSEWRRPFWFSPFKVNEPLLDKRVLPLCEEMNRRNSRCNLRLFSNGSTLTDANVDRIAGLKRLTHLWVSLNEYREAEYEKLMGLSWKRTTEALDRLHARDDFPHTVMLSCVGHPNEVFRRYCFDRWPKFESMAIKRDAWIDFIDPQDTIVPDRPCWRWFELNIMADGRASLCCMDGKGEYSIGDITNRRLLDVYNDPAWRQRRELLVSRRTLDPCGRCTY